jgi:hypothetical protein
VRGLFILFRHLKRRHADVYKDYEQKRNGNSVDSSQTSMSSFVDTSEGKYYTSMHPRQKLLINSLVNNVIVNCGLPVSIVDNNYFRAFLADLDPKFAVPCHQTVSSSILPALLKARQEKLQALLDSCEYLSLTADIWSDRRSHSFLGITVHAFVKGHVVSQLLSFKSFHGSHTGQKIADALEAVITENRLQHKVQYVITDNTSNMIKAMTVLFDSGDENQLDDNSDPSMWEDIASDEVEIVLNNLPTRMSCFAHSVQLVIRDGLASTSVIRNTFAKCSKLSNLVHQSPLFRSAYEAELGQGKSIPASNDTRWNSVYRQLKAITELDQAKLCSLLQQSNHENLIMTSKEFQQLRELVSILEPFAEATDITQGEKTVTVSCIVPVILSLTKFLMSMLEQFKTFTTLINNLLQGLYDRFSDIYTALGVPRSPHLTSRLDPSRRLHFDNNVLLMAPALDPRFGFQWLDDHPGSNADKEELRYRING